MFTPGEKVGSFTVVARLWTRPGSITFLAKREDGAEPSFVAVESLDRAANDDGAKRNVFLERAHAMATARVEGIPSVLEMGEERGHVWVAREFTDGITFAQLLAALARKKLRPSPAVVASIVLRASAALDALKQGTGLDHGAIDADRILIGFDGRVSIVSFLSSADTVMEDARALGCRLHEGLTLKRAKDELAPLPGDGDDAALSMVAIDAAGGSVDVPGFAASVRAACPAAADVGPGELSALVAHVVDAPVEKARTAVQPDIGAVLTARRPKPAEHALDKLSAPMAEGATSDFSIGNVGAPPLAATPSRAVPPKAAVAVGKVASVGVPRPVAPPSRASAVPNPATGGAASSTASTTASSTASTTASSTVSTTAKAPTAERTPATGTASPVAAPATGAVPARPAKLGSAKKTLMMNQGVVPMAAGGSAAEPPTSGTATTAAAMGAPGANKRVSIPPPLPPEALRASVPPPAPQGGATAPRVSVPPPPPAEALRRSLPPPPAGLGAQSSSATLASAAVAMALPGSIPAPAPTPSLAPSAGPDAGANTGSAPAPMPTGGLGRTLPSAVQSPPESMGVPKPVLAPEVFAPTAVPDELPDAKRDPLIPPSLLIGGALVLGLGIAVAYWAGHQHGRQSADTEDVADDAPGGASGATEASGAGDGIGSAPMADDPAALGGAAAATADAQVAIAPDLGVAAEDAGVDAGFDAGFDAGVDAGSEEEELLPPPSEQASPVATTARRRRTTRRAPTTAMATAMTAAPATTTMRRARLMTDF